MYLSLNFLSARESAFLFFFLSRIRDSFLILSARRLLSPHGNTRLGHDSESGVSAGTKRRLHEELQQTTSALSSLTYATLPLEIAEASQQQQRSQNQSFASEEMESKKKRAKVDTTAGSRNRHSSAFDLVDDSLHISSEDEFPQFDIPMLPSNTKTDKF